MKSNSYIEYVKKKQPEQVILYLQILVIEKIRLMPK